jgi:hypothetical protein
MSARLYRVGGAASPTTAAEAVIATGAVIKTLVQVATPSTCPIVIVAWGISFDGSAAATPGKCELLQTDVAGTGGTSLTPTLWGDPNTPAALCVGATNLTCFGPSAEGTITATRVFDAQLIAPTVGYSMWYPLGYQPWVPVSKYLRIRVTFGTGVNAYPWIIWEE